MKIIANADSFGQKPIEYVSTLGKRVGPAAVTLEEYVSAARRAAKRKRKHTDLKRSGVLEAKRQAAEAAREAAAAVEAKREPLHPAPAWSVGMDREGRAVRCDGVDMDGESARARDHDVSLFRLSMTASSPQAVSLRWWFPPANPGSSNAWVGLFKAHTVTWGTDGSPCGMVGTGGTDGGRVLYKLITRNDVSGTLSFGTLAQGLADDLYVFTLQADYGRICRATSERFRVVGGRIVEVFEGTLSSDWPPVGGRKARQQSADISGIKRSADKDSELLDERCYFPLTAVEVALPEKYADARDLACDKLTIKRIYSVVDKASYLDWGLTSDYDVAAAETGGEEEGGAGAGESRRSARVVDKPAMLQTGNALQMSSTQYSSTLQAYSSAQHAARRSIDSRKTPGMGSGSAGSEGYGEATTGSAHKIGLLLTHLRSLVLEELHDTHWGLMWDLGPHSTFLDIGSGYGKVVLHLRLIARMRRAVGMECVASRDTIAKQALFTLESEAGVDQNRVPPFEQSAASLAPAAASAPSAAAATPAADDASPTSADGVGSSSDSGTDPGSELATIGDGPPRVVRSGPFDGVEFLHGDATIYGQLSYTHIYIFDWVFSQNTLRDMAQVLQRSPFYILCSFRKVSEWWGHGLVKIQPVAKLQGFRTTGGEGMTCFVYVNLEKVPAQ